MNESPWTIHIAPRVRKQLAFPSQLV